ncbi:DUF2125 domain-containing protein [Phaeovulum sp.]|uniref:DUF2125 domain-containing protein n=1 Tax=Phaeovulum sp. TaxID=2934796 RepID=UPI00272FA6CB|nr:DUF2125 domain-containing protein [Phaeovulum sp.]
MRRRLISALVALAVLAALGWGAGAFALRQGADAALRSLRDQGRGNAGAVTLAGFPGAFSLQLDTPRLHQGLLAWQADWLRLSFPSYAPWRLRLDLSQAQTLRIGLRQYLLVSENMHAALMLRPGATLALESAAVVSGPLHASLDGGGPAMAADQLALTLAAAGGGGDYRLDASLAGFSLPVLLQAPYGLAERGELLSARLVLGLSAPLDRHAQATAPRLLSVGVEAASLRWGEAQLAAEGAVRADANGRAEGQITLSTPDWHAVVALALALRLVQPPYGAALSAELAPLASADGTLTIELGFRGGMAWLGPVLLGAAPYLQ